MKTCFYVPFSALTKTYQLVLNLRTWERAVKKFAHMILVQDFLRLVGSRQHSYLQVRQALALQQVGARLCL